MKIFSFPSYIEEKYFEEFLSYDIEFYLDGSGAEMAVPRQESGLPSHLIKYDLIKQAIKEVEKATRLSVRHLMLNKLPGKTLVPIHTDPMKNAVRYQRWHLPIVTNPFSCFYWDKENGIIIMKKGFWWGPIPHWEPHQVGNIGEQERVHLVIDLS